jgi:hypothetical protein
MGLRVKEGGKSESYPVMGWIGVEPFGNITPRESGQTSTRSFITRELGKPTKEAKQMRVNPMQAEMMAGAASHNSVDWHAIDWQKAHRNVRRLQARIEGDAGRQMG